jgi:L-methionine (R)-S-oxide reductase
VVSGAAYHLRGVTLRNARYGEGTKAKKDSTIFHGFQITLLQDTLCLTFRQSPIQSMSLPAQPAPDDWNQFLAITAADYGCSTGTLHRYDEADKHLKLVAQLGIPPHLMPVIQSIPIGKGIAGVAAERRQPVELCNLQTDSSGIVREGAKTTQVQGSLAVPVLDGVRLCGTLGIGKREAYDFTEEEKAGLTFLAASIASRLLPQS